MADPVQPDLYSLPISPPNFDEVGKFYLSFCLTWTVLLFSGMGFLIANRNNPILKIRGLLLSQTAILCLHAYWILAQLTYPVGLTLPVIAAYDTQYFFMGIWFPMGIALFHASNTRFLYVAKLQKQYAQSPNGRRKRSGCNGADSSWLCRLRNLDYPTRVLIYIGLAMIVQVLLTVGMWLACTKYHPSFGVAGTELHGGTVAEQMVELSRGWEWWPTALWQVIWTWIVAPTLIWRAWGIRDTLGWRFQTISCCIANLHATPMWLISMYLPVFNPINQYFAPSEWIHLSVMFFEIFTIFVPCFLVIRQRNLRKRAADSNAKWETASRSVLRASSSVEWKSSSVLEKGLSIEYMDKELGDRLFTMSALDHVLNFNPGPLQEFSALRDFSGENIAFLTRVAKWKSSWPEAPDEDRMRNLFTRALVIYTDLISPRDAEFPINLSSQDLKYFETIFEKPARILCGEARVDPALPFSSGSSSGTTRRGSDNSSDALEDWFELGELAGRVQYAGEISDAFDISVFDRAHTHIKYLVLTNTWPKFVTEIQQQRHSGETERSDGTGLSNLTPASRGSDFMHSVLQTSTVSIEKINQGNTQHPQVDDARKAPNVDPDGIEKIDSGNERDLQLQTVQRTDSCSSVGSKTSPDTQGIRHDLLPTTNLDEAIVGWESQDDPEMPLNFSGRHKWIWVGLLSLITLLTPFASSILSPAIARLDTEFGNDNEIVGSMTVSIYLLGYVVGPVFIALLSEMYGRKPVLSAANAFFCFWQIGCALAPNIETLIISRFFSGVGGAGCLTLGGSIIGDLFSPEQRAFAMGMWNIGPLLAESIGWRFDFWIVLAAATAVTILMGILNKETSHKVLIQRKTARLQKELSRVDLKNCYEDSSDRSKAQVLVNSLIRPLKMLVLSPLVFFLSLYISFVFGVVYLLYTTIPTVFEETYGFDPSLTGLVYISLGFGNILGWLVVTLLSDKTVIALAQANDGVFVPEMRLTICITFGAFLPVTLFWYGWSTFYVTHWASPILSLVPYGFGIMGLFLSITTYLVDSYPTYAASAIAANIILRSIVGALLPLAGPPLYTSLGLGWGNSVLGFICIAMIPFPIIFYTFGARLRKSERFQL
ncbi:major facilitator superfamily domain-containing protein [Hypoxylon cercidicola]|nr:major facilitator superfamily domain-containing protein [Hypoxylon cercidicola]